MNLQQFNRVKKDLSSFVNIFTPNLGRIERVNCCRAYISGLIIESERKSIKPIADKVFNGNHQSLQQFIKDSPWSHVDIFETLNKFMFKKVGLQKNNIFILDDTGIPKKGSFSVGVSRQYCGNSGKVDNCQTIVSWHYSCNKTHFPLNAQLYLPESWTSLKDKMDRAGVPTLNQKFKEKWKIALDLLDEVKFNKPKILLFDAGYGTNRLFLHEIEKRKCNFIGHIKGEESFWMGKIKIDKISSKRGETGRKRKYSLISDRRYKGQSASELINELFKDDKNVKSCTIKLIKPKKVDYVATTVYEKIRQHRHRVGPKRKLIGIKNKNGSIIIILSNMISSSNIEIVKLSHERYKIELGYRQLKNDLGFDHFEGRSWRGLHHHVSLSFMAFCFLKLQLLKKKL